MLAAGLAVLVAAGCASAPEPVTPSPDRPPRAQPRAEPARVERMTLPAPFAADGVVVEVHLPHDAGRGDARHRVVYLLDGQDSVAVGLAPTLARLQADGAVAPLIAVAVHMPPDRMAAYGLSDRGAGRSLVGQSRFGPIGADAHAHAEWVSGVLVPWIDARYPTRPDARGRAIVGWSLGALAAFNLGWQYPEVFATVGAFSPSFWVRGALDDDGTRLAQAMVHAGPRRDGLRLWLAVGTTEETDDRDGDGIIDAIDDVLDLVHGQRHATGRRDGLRQLGYRIGTGTEPGAPADVVVWELPDGRHEQASWARMLPSFLQWAFEPPATD